MSDAGIIIFPTGNPNAYEGLRTKFALALANGTTSCIGTNPRKPARRYRCDFSAVLITLATSAANTTVSVSATDAQGAFSWGIPLGLPAALPTLAGVNFGAGGTNRASGSIVFESAGLATDVSIVIAGITTPGSIAGTFTAIFTPIG